jgi:hypothetical protein
MKTLKALKRVRLGNAKKLTKAGAFGWTAEVGSYTYQPGMN